MEENIIIGVDRGGSLIAALSRIELICPSGVMVLSEVKR